jgi:hypothetical protein
MLTVETTMIRRLTGSVLLLVFAVIYALPLSAAFSPANPLDCCVGGMCARPGHMAKTAPARKATPVCPVRSFQHSTMPCCEASACERHDDNVIYVGLFVLSAPMEISRPEIQTQVVPAELESMHPIFPLPETPPPRFLST